MKQLTAHSRQLAVPLGGSGGGREGSPPGQRFGAPASLRLAAGSEVDSTAERPDSPELAERAGGWLGAYLHIPFCARVCPYCDFAVVEGKDHLMDRYLVALEREIAMEPPAGPLHAVYVGGGTPSRVPPGRLSRLIEGLGERFGLSEGAEVSLEANPEDWTARRGEELLQAGFTRISFGVQSFDAGVLSALGRRHSPRQAERAVREALRAGFPSVNLDLIYGTPGETLASWGNSVERALGTGVPHLSAYALTVERGTPLSRAVRDGAPAPDPDDQAEKWELAERLAEGAGLIRYEVSNFARPGHACRYNLLTWARGRYLAFGAGAHRHRDGTRSWNVRRLEEYLRRVEAGESPVSGREAPQGWAAERERLMLGLRRAAGVEAGPGGRRLLDEGAVLEQAGILSLRGDRLVVERPLLTDEVIRRVLALEDGEC